MPQQQPHNARTLAKFVENLTYDMFSADQITRLKQSLLDTLGAAIAAFDEPTLRSLRVHVKDFNSSGPCSLIGGVRCAPDMAAYHNSGLVGFLDMNDVYLGRCTTSYPSDMIPAVLAALEYSAGNGRDLLRSMGASYVAQIALNQAMAKRNVEEFSFQQTAIGAAVGVSSALKLDAERMVNGLNIAAAMDTCPNPVACGNMSDWVHIVRPNAVRHGVEAAFFAMRGMGGVAHELEGEDRVPDLLAGYTLKLNTESLLAISKLSTRKYIANAHAQSAVEAAVHIRHLYDIKTDQIASIKLETFEVAYTQLGGGNGVDCVDIVSREEAVNSLPFLIAAALLNGTIAENHFTHRYIRSQDMQALRALIEIERNKEFDAAYPEQLCHRLSVTLKDGTTHQIRKCDYLGHHSKPMDWSKLEEKFHRCAKGFANVQLRNEIVEVVKHVESHPVSKLTSLLARVAPV